MLISDIQQHESAVSILSPLHLKPPSHPHPTPANSNLEANENWLKPSEKNYYSDNYLIHLNSRAKIICTTGCEEMIEERNL